MISEVMFLCYMGVRNRWGDSFKEGRKPVGWRGTAARRCAAGAHHRGGFDRFAAPLFIFAAGACERQVKNRFLSRRERWRPQCARKGLDDPAIPTTNTRDACHTEVTARWWRGWGTLTPTPSPTRPPRD